MEFYLKHIQGNVLSLQVAEASIRVGKKPIKTSSKPPKDILIPCAFHPLLHGTVWIYALGICAGPFRVQQQESQDSEPAGSVLCPPRSPWPVRFV